MLDTETITRPTAAGPAPAPEPVLLRATDAAAICGISLAAFRNLFYRSQCPAPVKLGRSKLWRKQELLDWIKAGAPPRDEWNAILAARAEEEQRAANRAAAQRARA